MQLFYKADFETEPVLDETDSKHCIKVLRHKAGDEIWVTDGAGNMFRCIISDPHPKKTALQVLEIRKEEKPQRNVHLAIAPTKNLDRMTYLMEKAVEIGLSEISFVKTLNSERKEIKTDRMERVAVSAMKQSLKSRLPVINEMETLTDFLVHCAASQKYIAHLSENAVNLSNEVLGDDVCVLIGPEGDFTEQEVSLAGEHAFRQVSLGNSRLRTETAGLVAVTLLNLL